MKTSQRIAVAFLVACTTASGLVGQSDESDARKRIEEEILEKQRKMREGEIIRANVRVTVRLQNGSRLRGVVKDGRFIERPDQIAFVETDVENPLAGLRIWYSNNTNSYIFLPYSAIKRYRIGEKLTDEEVEEIGARIEKSRREAAAQRERALAEKARKDERRRRAQEHADNTPAQPGGGGEQAESKLTAAQRKLLADYPPSAGWSLDKLQTLERNKIVIGSFPNEKEAAFIENFAAWNEAYEIWKSEQQPADPTPATPVPLPVDGVTPPAPTPGGSGGV